MKVLIACEQSQTVCKAFRQKGHEAYSADIKKCSGGAPEWHIQGDVLKIINGNCQFVTQDGWNHIIDGKWDLIIAHPPCTYLSNVATRSYSLKCSSAEDIIERWQKRACAAVMFMQIANAECDRIAIQNPVGFMNGAYRKPDQIIQPYYFAEDENDTQNYQMKTTCLWLKGLNKLDHKSSLRKPEPVYIRTCKNGKCKRVYFQENHGKIGKSKHGKNDAEARSKTFSGIARAMAQQWGGNI